ncbi:ribokinase [Algoriphagus formosus]|uniref:ribokinase n=1 Tax=Algoriphagus formosus TaxID=2007308 RepID=UPI003F6E8AA8
MLKILVVGSSNTDLVLRSSKLPKPGETVTGGQFFQFQGGKGANQAVAAAKLGGQVSFLAKVGDDAFGKQALAEYQTYGLDTKHVIIDSTAATGVALILVDENGENSISVASGANANLLPEDILAAEELIRSSDLILAQLETPFSTIETLSDLAFKHQKMMILNPAPVMDLPQKLLQKLYFITPNEHEASYLTGEKVDSIDTAKRAAETLIGQGVKNVLITLGASGSYYLGEEGEFHTPAPKVKAMDTTAAGDTFNGAFVVSLAEGKAFDEAIKFASQAAAISVTRMGAQVSQPFRKEVSI